MHILVATDAWRPQVNGVVRTYERLAVEVEALGARLSFLTPSDFRTLPCPTYPEIRLAHQRGVDRDAAFVFNVRVRDNRTVDLGFEEVA